MGEDLYREVMGLREDEALPGRCDRCGQAVEEQSRHLLVVVHAYAAGADDQAWCLCTDCATLCVDGVAERIAEPVD